MPAVGDPILAEDLLFARLTSNHALAASDTTLENVTGLSVSVPANSVYVVQASLRHSVASGTTEDIKYGFSLPTGASMTVLGHGGAPAGLTGFTASDMTVEYGAVTSGADRLQFGTSTTNTGAQVTGLLITGSSAGTFQVMAAQNTSGSNVVTVSAGSYILLTRVG